MCGLILMHKADKIGFLSSDKDSLKQMLVLNSLRGVHSTGIAGGSLLEDDASIIKCVGSPYNLYEQKNTDEFFTRMISKFTTIIGHGRFATKGGIDAINAHPYKEGHIVLAHNGTINNFHQLKDKDKHANIEVDSHLVAKLIEEQGAEVVLPKISGAFVFAWIDLNEKTFNIARNSQRPLYACKLKNRNVLYFASEEETLEWNANRNNVLLDSMWEVKTNKIYTYPFGSIEPTIREFKNYTYQVANVSNPQYRKWNYHTTNWDYTDYEDVDIVDIPLTRKEKKALEKKKKHLSLVTDTINKVELVNSMVSGGKIEVGSRLHLDIVGFTNNDSTQYMHMNCSSKDFPNVKFTASCLLGLYKGNEDSVELVGEVSSIFRMPEIVNGKSFYVHLRNPIFIKEGEEGDEERITIKTTVDSQESITLFRLKELAKDGCAWCLGHVPLDDAEAILIEDSTTEAVQQLICPVCTDSFKLAARH